MFVTEGRDDGAYLIDELVTIYLAQALPVILQLELKLR